MCTVEPQEDTYRAHGAIAKGFLCAAYALDVVAPQQLPEALKAGLLQAYDAASSCVLLVVNEKVFASDTATNRAPDVALLFDRTRVRFWPFCIAIWGLACHGSELPILHCADGRPFADGLAGPFVFHILAKTFCASWPIVRMVHTSSYTLLPPFELVSSGESLP